MLLENLGLLMNHLNLQLLVLLSDLSVLVHLSLLENLGLQMNLNFPRFHLNLRLLVLL